jgi:hypothetical protein
MPMMSHTNAQIRVIRWPGHSSIICFFHHYASGWLASGCPFSRMIGSDLAGESVPINYLVLKMSEGWTLITSNFIKPSQIAHYEVDH